MPDLRLRGYEYDFPGYFDAVVLPEQLGENYFNVEIVFSLQPLSFLHGPSRRQGVDQKRVPIIQPH